jgi:hypothetical protein
MWLRLVSESILSQAGGLRDESEEGHSAKAVREVADCHEVAERHNVLASLGVRVK